MSDAIDRRTEKVMITVADDRLSDLAVVVDALRAAGLTVDEVLEAAGMVTGTASAAAFDALARVPGVVEVERQRVPTIAPPNSDVQ